MSRTAKLGPSWLTDLLCQWALRSDRNANRGLGYYRINPMLRDGIPYQAKSHEPIGYSDQDFRDIENAVNALDLIPKLAVMRYCKPGMVSAIDAEYPRDTRMWMYYLKQGLASLEISLDRRTAFEKAMDREVA